MKNPENCHKKSQKCHKKHKNRHKMTKNHNMPKQLDIGLNGYCGATWWPIMTTQLPLKRSQLIDLDRGRVNDLEEKQKNSKQKTVIALSEQYV